MKRLIYILLGAMLTLSACFEDEGNYDYQELYPPHWVQDFSANPKTIVGNLGYNVICKGSTMFTWDTDSLERASQVRYEWIFNGTVVSEEIDFSMPTDELMKKAGITKFSGSSGQIGTFNVIDRQTGVTFMAKVNLWLYPFYGPYTWFALIDDNGQTKVASLSERSKLVNGQTVPEYVLIEDAYAHQNEGASIPGKPLHMSWSLSRHVGAFGSLTVLTDQAAYELNAEDLTKYGELQEWFLDGPPADFQPILRADIDRNTFSMPPTTFLVNKDGKVYTRIMSDNYLGGQFLNIPYDMGDGKDYAISLFGQARFGGTLSCYDEINRRIIMACSWREDINNGDMGDGTSVYRINMKPLTGDTTIPVYGFPEGTEVLHICATNHISWGISGTWQLYTVFYNDPNYPGVTLAGDFMVDNKTFAIGDPMYMRWLSMPQLDKDSQILCSGNYRSSATADGAKYRNFYTLGNELWYMQRGTSYSDSSGREYIKFPATFASKITSLSYDYFDCERLIVGCENGEIYLFNIKVIKAPILLYEGKVQGKVMTFKQTGTRTSNQDNF